MNGKIIKGLMFCIFALLVGHGANIRLYQIHFDVENFIVISVMAMIMGFGSGILADYLMNRDKESQNYPEVTRE